MLFATEDYIIEHFQSGRHEPEVVLFHAGSCRPLST